PRVSRFTREQAQSGGGCDLRDVLRPAPARGRRRAATEEHAVTFCLGMNLQEGIVGIADTRIISGNECITARKVSVFQIKDNPFFIMASGLRSVRDKSMIYLEQALEEGETGFTRLFQVVNAYAAQIRRVASEDKAALVESGLQFNIHAIVGGQLEHDREH